MASDGLGMAGMDVLGLETCVKDRRGKAGVDWLGR